ncbi:MAG: MmcQ/YjbR family DNA-binding protein [Deltaproteobacteria bacterium]|jgi:predicted DNA-binding protein (MmcQ/YjbR family)|nr:MmcQ/YjbR family DNA-binding protein [Deltaproteobacteria bacterium]
MDQNYPWLEKYILGKSGSAKEFHQDFQCDRFLVGGKMFAMRGHDRDGRPILTLKLDPGRGEGLRSRYGE